MADQTPNNPTNPPTSPGAAGGEQPPAPRKKSRWGRRILIAAGVVVVLLVVLVLLIPTIASMGFVRSIVVGKINDNLNGKVAIDSWSLGWTGGIDASGVSVVGPAGEKVVDVKTVHTDLSLLDGRRDALPAFPVGVLPAFWRDGCGRAAQDAAGRNVAARGQAAEQIVGRLCSGLLPHVGSGCCEHEERKGDFFHEPQIRKRDRSRATDSAATVEVSQKQADSWLTAVPGVSRGAARPSA